MHIINLLNNNYNLDFFFNCVGNVISADKISNVINMNLDGHDVYIKRYYQPGKKFYRKLLLGTKLVPSKAQNEVQNLLYFRRLGLNTPEILYYSEVGTRACIVTKEVSSAVNLFSYFNDNSVNKENFRYLLKYVDILSKLHNQDFIHRDYKLRNVLLGKAGDLYLIDCPNGFKLSHILNFIGYFWLKRLKIRDLALAARDLKGRLTIKQALLLYKAYINPSINMAKNKLNNEHKKGLKLIIEYFNK